MERTFKIVFLGTGVSTAIPNIRHVLDMDAKPCPVCIDAMQNTNSKNKRNNVSIAIIFQNEQDQNKCILIDAGKTLRDTCLTTLVKHSIREVNGLLITHGHADAILGIDDLRDLQTSKVVLVPDGKDSTKSIAGFQITSGPMRIFLTEPTFQTVSNAFPYLTICPPCYLDEKNKVYERRVALLEFNVINDFDQLQIEGMPIQCFPVYHGGTYISLGFMIGQLGEFVYISDIKNFPEESWKYLQEITQTVGIKTLVIDVLNWKGIFSHMGFDEAMEVVQALNPQQVYFTGMTCSMGLHDEIQEKV